MLHRWGGTEVVLERVAATGADVRTLSAELWAIVWSRACDDVALLQPSMPVRCRGQLVFAKQSGRVSVVLVDAEGKLCAAVGNSDELQSAERHVGSIVELRSRPDVADWSITVVAALGLGIRLNFAQIAQPPERVGLDRRWLGLLRSTLGRIRDRETQQRRELERSRRTMAFVEPPVQPKEELRAAQQRAHAEATAAAEFDAVERSALQRAREAQRFGSRRQYEEGMRDERALLARRQARYEQAFKERIEALHRSLQSTREQREQRVYEFSAYRDRLAKLEQGMRDCRDAIARTYAIEQRLELLERATLPLTGLCIPKRADRALLDEIESTVEALVRAVSPRELALIRRHGLPSTGTH